MTIHELLKQSGVKYTRQDARKLGMTIMRKAGEKKVKWTKKEELVEVNNFPETFTSEMQQIVADYFTSKQEKQ